MAIGGMTPYGPVGSNPYARIEAVRPVQRRQDDQNSDDEAVERAEPAPRAPRPRPNADGQGRLVDLSI